MDPLTRTSGCPPLDYTQRVEPNVFKLVLEKLSFADLSACGKVSHQWKKRVLFLYQSTLKTFGVNTLEAASLCVARLALRAALLPVARSLSGHEMPPLVKEELRLIEAMDRASDWLQTYRKLGLKLMHLGQLEMAVLILETMKTRKFQTETIEGLAWDFAETLLNEKSCEQILKFILLLGYYRQRQVWEYLFKNKGLAQVEQWVLASGSLPLKANWSFRLFYYLEETCDWQNLTAHLLRMPRDECYQRLEECLRDKLIWPSFREKLPDEKARALGSYFPAFLEPLEDSDFKDELLWKFTRFYMSYKDYAKAEEMARRMHSSSSREEALWRVRDSKPCAIL